MGNPQEYIKFRSVEDFLDYLPKHELIIVEKLREIIFENIPDCKEKLAYNVPFYYRHSRICYIWPSSVPWGGIKAGVALGFCKGNLLMDNGNYLKKGDKKVIAQRTFRSISEIDTELVSSFLQEAYLLDKEAR
ncbi:MAG: DUF1801 domain-containing protein [Bacteroidota bacterium]